MTFASIIVPAYNVEATLAETLTALLVQTYPSFEIIVVDDGSTDGTATLLKQFGRNPQVRVITQKNRGLAGARNTGIAAAKGAVIGFCDSDDLWHPSKLERHMIHLQCNPQVGLSYSGSALINDAGKPLRQTQSPRLKGITPAHIFKRNPIGNGSALVARKAVFEQIAFRPPHETVRDWFFDETFRQSEDIECWLRIALTTAWRFEGIPDLLTQYRISAGGLSAGTERQFAAWSRMVEKLRPLDPAFFDAHVGSARAYQLRYLCRRAIKMLDGERASALGTAWLREGGQTFREEPIKSVTTWACLMLLRVLGPNRLRSLFAVGTLMTGKGVAQ